MNTLESQLNKLAISDKVAVVLQPSQIAEISAKLLQHLKTMMDKWCTAHNDDKFSGGKMRRSRGEEIERFVRYAVTIVGETCEMNVRAIKGGKDKKILSIDRNDCALTKAHQVDVHVYKADRFVMAIECKAYLDSCYYVRACDDFRLFDKFGYDLKKFVFAMEDSIDAKTKAFTDIVTDNTCDDIFYMLEGKRMSSKPIYDEKHRKPVNEAMLERFVRALHTSLDTA